MKLDGKTILITGGAAGIGLALAIRFSALGKQVIVCGRNQDRLDEAQADIPGLITRVCDVADAESRHALVAWLATDHPDLNGLINNAGVQHGRDFAGDPGIDTLDDEVAINLTAPIHLIAELIPALKRQEKAWIVNVSSGLAFSPMADVPVYCATKAALHSFTLSLRHQLRATNVRVVELAPPIVDTGLGSNGRSAGTANRHMMSAEDFASEAVAQLEADRDEILIGMAAESRRHGEALFERMNSRA
ncbi:SDR family oxidoreductase [Sphingomonas mollis]|uniref:SDR family NAD(P)-dependent oxidoreductase n=1 Tax=Sphingomonas mollis TaxID=2795726 RepID=A0ABS0XSI2_9SPHN|nr:SDR family NAD(P)-dependent oxidoreductase [Sphingomonas sp. BT553]MBJ6122996.1 SDR family NAD(P)-dependent oxidoreductase [Sphingomonas sp. BT553]